MKTLIRTWMGIGLVHYLCGVSASAATLLFSFTGQITEKRGRDVSVFTGEVGGEFTGFFSYDTSSLNESRSSSGFYDLIDFKLDGRSLNVSTGPEIPFRAGVFVHDGGDSDDWLEVRGFYLPAMATVGIDGFNDNGAISIWLFDSTGGAFSDGILPEAIDLSQFDDTRAIGPIFGVSPFGPNRDEGLITGVNLIPEPRALALVMTGLILMSLKRVVVR
ncbi:hypothetical protein ACFQY0_06495 [Haloferula chungangensis]|uniref:PEP-CTERM sorting domain-containing protein n=1 Tax=Haloferula chungangensis TaxID=1048331 RepID=A0ABW2L540_9BACT